MSQPEPIQELVGFLSSPRQEIRLIACGNLVGYSAGPQNSIFKPTGLKPIRDLKVLVKDHHSISESAVKILVNVSDDVAVLDLLATDDAFLELLLSLIINPAYPAADYVAMLLANLAKHESFPGRLLSLRRAKPRPDWKLSNSERAVDQLMDLFVRGVDKSLNKTACFDYLAYLFADIARHPLGRQYLVEKQEYDSIIPLTKLIVFTEHDSVTRRKGVSSTIKNVLFDVSAHVALISGPAVNILPYILLPLMGPEEYDESEMLDMAPEVQFLPPTKRRDSDFDIISIHLESIMLLTTSREVRETLRELQVYPIIRELHLRIENDGVRELCERIVNVLQRDEEKDDLQQLESQDPSGGGNESDDMLEDLA